MGPGSLGCHALSLNLLLQGKRPAHGAVTPDEAKVSVERNLDVMDSLISVRTRAPGGKKALVLFQGTIVFLWLASKVKTVTIILSYLRQAGDVRIKIQCDPIPINATWPDRRLLERPGSRAGFLLVAGQRRHLVGGEELAFAPLVGDLVLSEKFFTCPPNSALIFE